MVTKKCQCSSGGFKPVHTGNPSAVDSLDLERAIIGVVKPNNAKNCGNGNSFFCRTKTGECCPLLLIDGRIECPVSCEGSDPSPLNLVGTFSKNLSCEHFLSST